MLIERMRRDFEGHRIGIRGDEAGQPVLHAHRPRRRVRGFGEIVGKTETERAHVAATLTQCREGLSEHPRTGRLAVGTGDPGREQATRRLAVEPGRDRAGLRSEASNMNIGHGQCRARVGVPGHRPGAAGHGILDMVQTMTLRTLIGEKQPAITDAAAVDRHAGDVHVRHIVGQTGQQRRQRTRRHVGSSERHHVPVPELSPADAVSTPGLSGGTRSSRSASRMTAANTGAATAPP